MAQVVPVILCGGEGSRLWPESQRERPKIFFEMGDGRSLLQHAMDRARLVGGHGNVLAVTNRACAELTARHWRAGYRHAGSLDLLVEPEARNTGPAIASAAHFVADRHGGDAIMVCLPSDHLIDDDAGFLQSVHEAATRAGSGEVVLFGITPDQPATSYGYIEHKDSRVIRFHEKPDAATAATYYESGRFLWNSGIVCARADRLLACLEQYAPELKRGGRLALEHGALSETTSTGVHLDPGHYSACPDISFDHAVLEKLDPITVLEAGFAWQDVGNWEHFGSLAPADISGNHVSGNVVLLDTRNSIVRAGQKPVGIIGLENVVVVDSPDGLLIAHADSVEQVKSLFTAHAPDGFNEESS